MPELEIDAVVFDVLGTLVYEPAGLRAGMRALDRSLDDAGTERLLSLWQRHVEREQRRIVDGERPFVTTDTLDREAAQRVADAAGIGIREVAPGKSTAGRPTPPPSDRFDLYADGLAGLATQLGKLRVTM
ncbi:hypothetical protein [Streptomyces sp. NPDC053560]|uniref:hypothetical protein n=1 Tax=Streptomyces sp. NPDC053560 TaxID=3365711 RepID=UPI0037D4DEBA